MGLFVTQQQVTRNRFWCHIGAAVTKNQTHDRRSGAASCRKLEELFRSTTDLEEAIDKEVKKEKYYWKLEGCLPTFLFENFQHLDF